MHDYVKRDVAKLLEQRADTCPDCRAPMELIGSVYLCTKYCRQHRYVEPPSPMDPDLQ